MHRRRAKIKRLTADDRERMIKMRAVPDGFDNVGALHSPYGAVHGLGAPMDSPVDFSSSYGHDMMRPLMVDVRRPEDGDHLSPTGLSPAFGSIGFNPSASMSSSDMLSPLSPTNASDRYGYSSMSSPLSAGSRATSNPFTRQNSLDAGMQLHNPRSQIRPLQPLQLRETMSRSRSDSLNSPLRSSMSWKGDSIDYTTYHSGSGSPQFGSRDQPLYPSSGMTSTPTTLGGYESTNYTGKWTPNWHDLKTTNLRPPSGSSVQSPTQIPYSGMQSSAMQPSYRNGSRLRAASATLPLGLDLRTQHRSVSSTGHNLQPSSHSPVTTRPTTTSHLAGVTSSYSASFPSAPLTAPLDFNLPRTPGFRPTGQDYSMPQMSAPINPPNDFSHAFQSMSSGSGSSTARAPIRDTYNSGSLGIGAQTSGTSADTSSDYNSRDSIGGLKREHSYTGNTSATTSGSTYGNTS